MSSIINTTLTEHDFISNQLELYNEDNPIKLFNDESLKIIKTNLSTPIEEYRRMIYLLYEMYNNEPGHHYEWKKYLDIYMNPKKITTEITRKECKKIVQQIQFVLLTVNKNNNTDLVGGFLIIPWNAREICQTGAYFTDDDKEYFGNEFTQVYITKNYRFNKNKKMPISFSYYLLSEYSKQCSSGDTFGWCGAQELSLVYEYMYYGWKYYKPLSYTNISKFSCITYPFLSSLNDRMKENNIIFRINESEPNSLYFKTIMHPWIMPLYYMYLYPGNENVFEIKSEIETTLRLYGEFIEYTPNVSYSEYYKNQYDTITNFNLSYNEFLDLPGSKQILQKNNDGTIPPYINPENIYSLIMKIKNVYIKTIFLNSDFVDVSNIISFIYSNTNDDKLYIKLKYFLDMLESELVLNITVPNGTIIYYLNKTRGRPNDFTFKKSFFMGNITEDNINIETNIRTDIENHPTSISDEEILQKYVEPKLLSAIEENINKLKLNFQQFIIESNIYKHALDPILNIVQISTIKEDKVMSKKEKHLILRNIEKKIMKKIDVIEKIQKPFITLYRIFKQYNYLEKYHEIINYYATATKAIYETTLKNHSEYFKHIFEQSTRYIYEEIILDYSILISFYSIKQNYEPYNKEKLNIFKKTNFGVEFEYCLSIGVINQDSTLYTKYVISNPLSFVINFFNDYSNKFLPKSIDNPNLNMVIEDMTGFGNSNKNEKYDKWRVHQDPTIRCDISKTYPIEIVSPILNFSDDNNIDNMTLTIRSILKLNNYNNKVYYSPGLFYLMCMYNFLIHNNVKKADDYPIITKVFANTSQGLHIHISNPYIQLEKYKHKYKQMIFNTKGEYEKKYIEIPSFCGFGVIIMAYFIRTFAYFEHVIRNFLRRPDDKTFWAKPIYYNRHRGHSPKDTEKEIQKMVYLDNLTSSITDKSNYESKNYTSDLYKKLKFNIIPKYFDTSVLENEPRYSQYRVDGAFSLKIYNNPICHSTNELSNNSCKAHFEVRLHHSTDDYAEIHNWILFLNLLLSSCIEKMYNYKNGTNENDLFNNLKKFPKNYDNVDVMRIMFNELFDNFIKNRTLKKFYARRCKINLINEPINGPNEFELHPPNIFNTNGEIYDNSLLHSVRKYFYLNLFDISREDTINKLDQIGVKSVQPNATFF